MAYAQPRHSLRRPPQLEGGIHRSRRAFASPLRRDSAARVPRGRRRLEAWRRLYRRVFALRRFKNLGQLHSLSFSVHLLTLSPFLSSMSVLRRLRSLGINVAVQILPSTVTTRIALDRRAAERTNRADASYASDCANRANRASAEAAAQAAS